MAQYSAIENKRIMVVDDERTIAETTAIILRSAGYEVRPVCSPEQALALMERWPAQVAVIDLYLNGMNGVDLALRIKAEHPECKLVLFSGDPSTVELFNDPLNDGQEFSCLAKPVPPRDFLSLMANLLS